jgi:paraquat-inducible protein A
MHLRKPASLSATWALVLAAIILFVPANLLPVMTTASLLGSQQDTIMSGVIFLWQSGSWPLAAVVFFASVMVPLLKIIALVHLTLSAQRRSRAQSAGAHAAVPHGGIRRPLVDARHLRDHHAGGAGRFPRSCHHRSRPGRHAFGAVVVLTMFAAMSFDPRLIWDPLADRTTSDHD